MRAIPNILTAFRGFVVSPVLVAYFYYESTHVIFSPARTWAHAICLALVVLGVLSDFDGSIARRFGWESKWGQTFDPLADKLFGLAMLAVVCLYFDDWRLELIVTPVIIIFAYSVTTTVMRMYGMISAPSRIAQWKTGVLMAAKIVFMLAITLELWKWEAWVYYAGAVLVWMTAIMCFFCMLRYLSQNRRQVRAVPAE